MPHMRMKPKDIRKKSTAELAKNIGELTSELREFRFGMSGGQKKNIRRARAIRVNIARIKTILGEQK